MTTADAANSWYTPAPGFWDEALRPDGRPREASADALRAVAAYPPAELAAAVAATVADRGITFRSTDGDPAWVVDPVPRVLGAAEWATLEAGLAQRVRALNAYVADVYGERRIFTEGAVPDRLLDAAGYVPGMQGVRVPGGVYTAIAGLDIVRDDTGRLVVLEDNLTTPSGMAYALAARAAVTAHLRPERPPLPLDGLPDLVAGAMRAAAPGDGDPAMVVLTDGPGNSAHWEHAWVADALGIPLVEPGDLQLSGGHLRHRGGIVDVVYRRTNADALDDEVGALLGPPLRAGVLGVVNAYGTTVGDDKLAHVYVEDMVRFYLGETPLLPSAPTFDLGRPDHLERALDTLGDLVVKPRLGQGGIGVVIAAQAAPDELEDLRRRIAAAPADWIAQPRIALSQHPTVIDGRLVQRHVDLRPFVFLHGPDDARVLPGGLTRVALEEGQLVVNSTRAGGAKDTWVV